LNSGSLTETNIVYQELIGNASPGAFVQSGGTHSIATGLYLGNGISAIGTYTLSGGSLTVPTVYVGNLAPGSFTQSGGTCSVSSELDEGVSTGSSGIYTLSGSGVLAASQEVIGDVTAGTLTQSGGTNSVANGLVLGQNLGATGIYNLNGGLLIVNGSLTAGDGSAALNMNGGTLHSGASFASGVPIVIGPGSIAVFDTGSGTMTLSTAVSGSGSVVKSGAGVLVLCGTNGYSGGTTVNSGRLAVLNPKSLLTGSNLTVGSIASLVFGSATVPVDAPAGLQGVPEPASLTLLGACALGIFVALRLTRCAGLRD
jgi:autotransporter-associated beta strand protein